MQKNTIATTAPQNIDTSLPGVKGTESLDVLDLSLPDTKTSLSFKYSRKTFYTVTLLQGKYTLEFEERLSR